MNGVHDLGGMHGFGPVEREADEPVFHAEWERHVLSMLLAMLAARQFHLDEFRRGIESMPPADYLDATYYERWLFSVSELLIEKGVIDRPTLDARTTEVRANPSAPLPEGRNPELLTSMLGRQRLTRPPHEATVEPRFRAGDWVRARQMNPHGHTRIPRYVRGKRGTVQRLQGEYFVPDLNAHGLGRIPEPVYSVRFDGEELWGASAEPNQTLAIDLWERYLEPV